MNREEAKDILQLCRPDHLEDLNDPVFKEALERLEQDPELKVWFEEQQLLDAEICAELCRITPPVELQALILSGMQAKVDQSAGIPTNNSEEEDPSGKRLGPVSIPVSNRSKILPFQSLIGIAAVILFASVLLIVLRKESTQQPVGNSLSMEESASNSPVNVASIPDIIEFLGQQIANFNGSQFEKRGARINELQNYLASSGVPSPTEIPNPLKTTPTIGCVSFQYNNTQMSMICFKNGQIYHLITIDKADLEKNLPNGIHPEAEFFEYQRQAFKIWSQGEHIYILSTEGTKEDIPEFI